MASTPPVLAWAAGTAGLIYENSLIGLSEVLGEAGEGHWQELILEDLRSWRSTRDTSHHRHAHGGMGSLDDLPIWDRPWLGSAFEQLRHLAGAAARAAGDDPERFVQYAGIGPLHIGYFRCRACNSGFVAPQDIDRAAATGWASYVVPLLVSSGQGAAVLRTVNGETTPDLRPTYRDHVESRLPDLGLRPQADERYWESPCPACGGFDWYRESLPIF